MTTINIRRLYTDIAVAGLMICLLWNWANAINEGFKGTIVRVVTCVELLLVVILSTVSLIRRGKDA